MSAKHTPGPWIAQHRAGADGNYRTEIFSPTHGGIATCEWTPKHCGNGVTATYREANACLIAAAPDLLAALQCARKVIADDREAFVTCNGQLALNPDEDPALFEQVGTLLFPTQDAEFVRQYDADLAQMDAAIAKATGERA